MKTTLPSVTKDTCNDQHGASTRPAYGHPPAGGGKYLVKAGPNDYFEMEYRPELAPQAALDVLRASRVCWYEPMDQVLYCKDSDGTTEYWTFSGLGITGHGHLLHAASFMPVGRTWYKHPRRLKVMALQGAGPNGRDLFVITQLVNELPAGPPRFVTDRFPCERREGRGSEDQHHA